jgi:hypothetical protein
MRSRIIILGIDVLIYILAIFMLVDMYSRLAKQIRQGGEGLGLERKKRL